MFNHGIEISCILLFATSWTVAHQAPLSMEFSRQEYWSGLPFPTPGDLPDPGIKPTSLESPALAGGFFTTEPLRKPNHGITAIPVLSIHLVTSCFSFLLLLITLLVCLLFCFTYPFLILSTIYYFCFYTPHL